MYPRVLESDHAYKNIVALWKMEHFHDNIIKTHKKMETKVICGDMIMWVMQVFSVPSG